jgi:protein ImuB
MVALSLYLPTFAVDLVRRWSRLDRRATIVLCRSDRRGELVVAMCPRAARAGVTLGMSIAHARALLHTTRLREPPHQIQEIDDERTARALKRLAAWSLRFVPIVAVDPPDGLLIDATGCERLYHGIARLIEQYSSAIQRLGIGAMVAAAPTYGGAWALARFGKQGACPRHARNVREALLEMPLEALRLSQSEIAPLRHVGIQTVANLLAIPRAAIADRYAPSVLLRLDQALGDAGGVIETIRPIRVREPVMAEQVFDGPTDRALVIAIVVQRLLARLAARLAEQECGCRRVEVRLDRSDLDPLTLCVRVAKPTRDSSHLWALLSPTLERAHLGFGVQGVRLVAGGIVRLPHDQEQAWEHRASADDAEIGKLVDTMTARLGIGSVLAIKAIESHTPELAFGLEPVIEISQRRAHREAQIVDADRPSRLDDPPRPIVVALLAPDGPIAMIREHSGVDTRVLASVGPERIEPEWWRSGRASPSHRHARDYFKVTTQDGRVRWIFRETGEPARWFVHGEWA